MTDILVGEERGGGAGLTARDSEGASASGCAGDRVGGRPFGDYRFPQEEPPLTVREISSGSTLKRKVQPGGMRSAKP